MLLNKFAVTKKVVEEKAIEEKVVNMNNCGFKGIQRPWGKYYGHNGTVVAYVAGSDDVIAEKAEALEMSIEEYKSCLRSNLNAYFKENFYLIDIADYTKVKPSDIIPTELEADLLEAQAEGAKFNFWVNYNHVEGSTYQVTLRYKYK